MKNFIGFLLFIWESCPQLASLDHSLLVSDAFFLLDSRDVLIGEIDVGTWSSGWLHAFVFLLGFLFHSLPTFLGSYLKS